MSGEAQLRRQAGWCASLGSPLYASLLKRAAADLEQGGPVARLLATHAEDPPESALALRLMGAVHRLVLEGRAPGLAPWYPSAGGAADAEAAWPAWLQVVEQQREALAPLLARGVQTNDCGRAGTLLGGFLISAERFGKPLRLLELGASGGLNLCWDRFRYEWTGGAWGDAGSTVRMTEVFRSAVPRWPTRVEIAERRGCDLSPVDVTTEEGRLTLLSYVWADQGERATRLRAACGIAARLRPQIDAARCGDWVEQMLREPRPGVLTVVFHSVVWQYLPAEEKAQVRAAVERAGAQSDAEAPLVWLRMEPAEGEGGPPLLTWCGFPEGAETVLARSSYHAPAVVWQEGLCGSGVGL